jgi:hypothetical protein
MELRIEDQPGAMPVSPYLFGNFVECGFGRQTAGMWAEKMYNRAFKPVSPYKDITWHWLGLDSDRYNAAAPFWHSGYEEMDWEQIAPSGNTGWSEGTESFKGLESKWVWNETEGARQGLRQRGIHIRSGEACDFSMQCGFFSDFAIRNVPPLAGIASSADMVFEKRRVSVRFLAESDPGSVLAGFEFDVEPVQKRYDAVLDLGAFEGRVIIEIVFTFKGSLMLSWCSLMPRDSEGGWRRDVVALLKEVAVPVIRFPGGCYASFFDWRDWVAPRERRKVLQSHFWGGIDENDTGVDEFLDLCARTGTEPQMCINMMSSEPYEAAALVEYCNGGDETPMGRVRRGNGIRRDVRVKFWEMDNEASRKWSPIQYAEQVVRFSRAMREVDPGIFVMMEFYSFGLENLAPMLAVAGREIDAVIHRSIAPTFLRAVNESLDPYNQANGTSIVFVNTEWLAETKWHEPFDDVEVPFDFNMGSYGRGDYAKSLNNRQIRWFYALNAATALLDFVQLGRGIHLANFNNCVNTWGQNIIEASKEHAWLSPAGKVFELFRAAKGAVPVGKSDEPAGLDAGGAPLVRAQALREAGSGDLLVYVVNKSSNRERLTLEGLIPQDARNASLRRFSAASPLARIDGISEEIDSFNPRCGIDIPPYSLAMLRIPKGD